jgi:hypothetical protein
MNNKIGILNELVDTQIRLLAEKLESVLRETNSKGSIRGGTWLEDAKNTIFGCVSYAPHNDPEEESIEAGITVTLEGKNTKFIADIYWSDGTPIAEITERILIYDDPNELERKVDELSKIAAAEMLRQMKVLVATSGLSRFRPHRT